MTADLSPTARALRFDRDQARRLRALAYRMLGSRAEAEDIVQEAWLRWAEVDEATVEHAGAFLSRLVTNLCLDKLRSAAVQREHYVGVWLPEPMLEDEALFGWAPGPEKQAEFAQDVSIAFMLALERLSPLERAAFLLHDVFDLDYDEIGRHLDRSEAACRQLISRARKNVKADYARREVAKEEADRLVAAFMHAVRSQDVSALARVAGGGRRADGRRRRQGQRRAEAPARRRRHRPHLHRLCADADQPGLAPRAGHGQRAAGPADRRRQRRWPPRADHRAGAGERAGSGGGRLHPAQPRQAGRHRRHVTNSEADPS
jgi:RNA polymerase sigma factor (sigma-70 family)